MNSFSRLVKKLASDETNPFVRVSITHGGAFILGFGLYLTLLYFGFLPGVMSRPPKVVNCEIPGVEALNQSFHERVSALQEDITDIQKKLSDPVILNSTQQKHKEAIRLLKEQISQERALFRGSLAELKRKCHE